ncbi:hypothetical protein MJH12_00580 [bacterium]|nr:hypothetical protein [bacterium]
MNELLKETWFKLAWAMLLICLLWGYTQGILYIALVTTDKIQAPLPKDVKSHFRVSQQPLLKSMLEGTMSEYVESEEDRQIFYTWMKNGATKKEYKEKVADIIEASCIECHAPDGDAAYANFEKFEVLQKTAIYSYLPHFKRILKKAHPHALAISLLIFPFVLSLAFWPICSRKKTLLATAPYIGLFLDLNGWFFMMFSQNAFALIMFGGALTAISIYTLGFGSLYFLFKKNDLEK